MVIATVAADQQQVLAKHVVSLLVDVLGSYRSYPNAMGMFFGQPFHLGWSRDITMIPDDTGYVWICVLIIQCFPMNLAVVLWYIRCSRHHLYVFTIWVYGGFVDRIPIVCLPNIIRATVTVLSSINYQPVVSLSFIQHHSTMRCHLLIMYRDWV